MFREMFRERPIHARIDSHRLIDRRTREELA